MLPAQDPPCGSLSRWPRWHGDQPMLQTALKVSIFAAIVLAGILSPPFACAQDLPARVHGITIPAIPGAPFSCDCRHRIGNRTGPTDGPRSTEPSTSLPVTPRAAPTTNPVNSCPSHFMARPNSRALRSSIRPLACASFTSPKPTLCTEPSFRLPQRSPIFPIPASGSKISALRP